METPRVSADAGSGRGLDPMATQTVPAADERGHEGRDLTRDVPAEAPADEPAIPSRVGRYLVLGRLGRGGMGVVLEAFDPELDRRVALKLLHPEHARRNAGLRLLREAQALARLSHPHVVQVHDVGVDGERVFMAMELVRGPTIATWLRERPRRWPEIVGRYVDAGRGLHAAHQAGLVHRDFKPSNVLVGDDGRVRVADFGLAGLEAAPTERAAAGPRTSSYLRASLTATGAVMGTPRYMAPEQHAGLPAGPAADQFAFCVALHEAVFGEHPFGDGDPPELVARVLAGRLAAPRAAAGGPPWLRVALRRGLATDPAARYPSLAPLLQLLERAPRRRRAWRWVGAGALALGLGLAVWPGLRGQPACRGGEAEIAAVWSDPQRAAVTAALGDEGVPGDREAVLRTLDVYAETWGQAHRAACLEHRDGALPTPTLDAALGCLQRGRAALEGVVQTIATGASGGRDAAAVAAARLLEPSQCIDRQRLALELRAPDEPARAAGVASLRERLARAEAVHDAGALERALAELAALAPEVEALGHAPLQAERALVVARLAMDRMDWPLAARELAAAQVQALRGGADAIAAEAMARALFVHTMQAGPDAHDPHDEAVARALVERVGAPPGLAALLANNAGVAAVMRGDRDRAARSFAEALARADEADDVDPVDHCGYLVNVARSTADPGARDALLARAQRLAEQALGPGHERTLELAMLRAAHLDDPAQALVHLAPACARVQARGPGPWPRCACHWQLAERHEALDRPAQARAAIDGALRCLDDAGAGEQPGLPALQRVKTAGYAAVLHGEHERALAWLEEAERGLSPQRALPWVALELADVALLRARSLAALGRGAEAIEGLRTAIATYEVEIARAEDRAPRWRREQSMRLLAALEGAGSPTDQRRSSIP